MTNLVSCETVREFVTIIAAQAKAALNGIERPGYLQMSRLDPDSEKLVPRRYALDDVEDMINDAITDARAGHNVYGSGINQYSGAHYFVARPVKPILQTPR